MFAFVAPRSSMRAETVAGSSRRTQTLQGEINQALDGKDYFKS